MSHMKELSIDRINGQFIRGYLYEEVTFRKHTRRDLKVVKAVVADLLRYGSMGWTPITHLDRVPDETITEYFDESEHDGWSGWNRKQRKIINKMLYGMGQAHQNDYEHYYAMGQRTEASS